MPKKNKIYFLASLLLAVTCGFGFLLSATLRSSHFIPQEAEFLTPSDNEHLSQLVVKYRIGKITSLQNGKTLTLAHTPRFFADIISADTKPGSPSSELLLLDGQDEVLLLESALPEVSDEMIAAFKALPSVKAAEANQTGALFASSTTFRNPVVKNQNPKVTNLDTFLNDGEPKKDVLIAVIDSGVDKGHPAFSGNIWQNQEEKRGKPNYDDDGNGFKDDLSGWNFADGSADYMDAYGHGTHITGIIAAKKTRLAEMTGVNPTGAKLMILKVAGKDKSLKLSNVLSALAFAEDKNADIVNMSFGFPKDSEIFHTAIKKLTDRGAFVVAAAGNNAENKKQFPAAFPEVVSVGSANVSGGRYKTSNYGEWVDISVPGKLLSTLPGSRYGTKSGTSQAAALVTGLLSASLSHSPSLSDTERVELLSDFAGHFDDEAFLNIQKKQQPEWAKAAVDILKKGRFPDSRERLRLGLQKVITFDEAAAMLLEYSGLKPEALGALREATIPITTEDISPDVLVKSVVSPKTDGSDKGGHYLSQDEMNELLKNLDGVGSAKNKAHSVQKYMSGKNPYVSREKFLDMVFQAFGNK